VEFAGLPYWRYRQSGFCRDELFDGQFLAVELCRVEDGRSVSRARCRDAGDVLRARSLDGDGEDVAAVGEGELVAS